MLKWRIIHWNY